MSTTCSFMQNKHNIPYFVSVAALQEVGFNLTVSENNTIESIEQDHQRISESQFAEILHQVGMDTKNHKFIVIGPERHRYGDNPKIHFTHRLMGCERLDKDWIESGNASLEAYLASSKMEDMLYNRPSMGAEFNIDEFDGVTNQP